MAELGLLISAPPICPRSNSSVSPAHSPLKMCDLDNIPLAEHYWHVAYKRVSCSRVPSRGVRGCEDSSSAVSLFTAVCLAARQPEAPRHRPF